VIADHVITLLMLGLLLSSRDGVIKDCPRPQGQKSPALAFASSYIGLDMVDNFFSLIYSDISVKRLYSLKHLVKTTVAGSHN